MDVIGVWQDQIVRTAGFVTVDEMAGVEGDAKSFHIVAKDDDRIWILRETVGLAFHAHQNAFDRSDRDQALQVFNLLIERRPDFCRGDGERYYFGRLGELATGVELIVILLSSRFDFEAVGDNVQAISFSAHLNGLFQVRLDFGRLEMFPGFVDIDFDVRELKVNETIEHIFER